MRECATTLEAEMSPSELALLRETIAAVPEGGRVLEIGTAAGGSLVAMLAALRDAGRRAQVVTIDPMRYFPYQLATVQENLRRNGFDPAAVEIRVGRAERLLLPARRAGERYDAMLIDGSHKYRHVVMDLAWSDLLTPTGRLLLHDHAAPYPGVLRAVSEFTRRNPYYAPVAQAESLIVLGRDPQRAKEYRRRETSLFDVLRAALAG